MKNFTFNGPFGDIACVVNGCRDKNAPVLIMAHGFRGSMEGGGRASVLAERLSKLCCAVRFNFNGSQILSKQILELQAVIAEVKRLAPQQKIFLLGRSMGGAASLITAALDSDICGLVLWAAPNNLRETFKTALGEEAYALLDSGATLHLADERGKLDLTPDFLTDIDKYDIDSILKNWRGRPMLLLHGASDETVNVMQAQRNFALAQGKKELHIFDGGDHSFTNCSKQAGEIIYKWLESCL